MTRPPCGQVICHHIQRHSSKLVCQPSPCLHLVMGRPSRQVVLQLQGRQHSPKPPNGPNPQQAREKRTTSRLPVDIHSTQCSHPKHNRRSYNHRSCKQPAIWTMFLQTSKKTTTTLTELHTVMEKYCRESMPTSRARARLKCPNPDPRED
jgi:hypothetical protein